MRQVTKKGLVTFVAAGGVLAMTGGGSAYADAGAIGSAENSPGVLSGNTVQAPVHVPVNACGNTINVVGALNPAFGNTCVNASDGGHGHHDGHDGGGSTAHGESQGSPGVASGNTVQAPVHVPVNACGNSVNVGGALNPSWGNECANTDSPGHPGNPEQPEQPGGPREPGEPNEPGEPGQPNEPNEPNEPGAPNEPDEPGYPGEPGGENPGGGHGGYGGGDDGGDGYTGAEGESGGSQPVPHMGGTEHVDGGELAATGTGPQLGMAAPVALGLLAGGAVLYRRARAAQVR
ncbi:chaplin [Streptomyces sp. YIM 98790]|uniref:chaplin n=1 Tax=Streptomyces sp. YIM 98790 TaxID=2689077 RepID=UPI00140ACE1A|nr:chaplin family protein [Streptomyces sp. YIM 98790]